MCTQNNQIQYVEAHVQLGDNEKLAYDKAIEAYQFHVNRYHTWMNYYSVFTGAFFVALYTVWPQETKSCCCCCHAASSSSAFLPIMIAILGLVASICWQASAIGHYSWMKSYIQILHNCENNVFSSPKLYIYSHIHGATKKCICTDYEYAPGYISTQKVTQLFIVAITAAWMVVIAFLAECDLSCILFLSCIAGAVILWIIMRWTIFPFCMDNLTGMSNN